MRITAWAVTYAWISIGSHTKRNLEGGVKRDDSDNVGTVYMGLEMFCFFIRIG